MIEKQSEGKGKSWFSTIKASEAAKIALIPVAAQLILFIYESGFCGVFQIPVTLIAFDWSDLFIVSTVILVVGGIVYYYGALTYSVIHAASEPIRDKLLRGFGSFLLLVVFFLAYGIRLWREWVPILIAVSFTLLNEFVLPAVQFRGKGSYHAKLAAHAREREDREAKRKGESLVEKAMEQLGMEGILVLLALFCVYHLGRASAMTKQAYLIASTNPETVVLWMGDDKFIVAPFDRSTKTMGPGFQILSVGQDPTITFYEERIGPLSLARPTATTTQLPTSTLLPPTSAATASLTSTPDPTSIPATETLTPTPRPSPSASPVKSPTQ